jgi:hypothetical protein
MKLPAGTRRQHVRAAFPSSGLAPFADIGDATDGGINASSIGGGTQVLDRGFGTRR